MAPQPPAVLTDSTAVVADHDRNVRTRRWVAIGTALLSVASLVVIALHVLPPTSAISPTRRTISEYQLTSGAWIFNAGVLGVALGSAALFAAAAVAGRGHRSLRTGLLLGGAWVVGMVLIALFTKTDWSVGPSLEGTVHRWGSIVAFLALPAAVPLLVRATGPSTAAGRWATLCAVLAPLWLVWIGVAMVVNGTSRWWSVVPLGLVERGLVATEVVALLLLALHLVRRGSATGPDQPGVVTAAR